MAQLKDTVISGALRVTESIIANTLKAPSESNGSNYSVGENGQVLKSNGTSNYWGNEDSYKMITQSFENDMVATKNYNKGDLFIVNNQLLRATSSIATGNSIEGNASIVDLGSIINEISSLFDYDSIFNIVKLSDYSKANPSFTIGKNARIIVFILDSTVSNCGCYYFISNNSGTPNIIPILSASNITINTSTSQKIIIEKTSTYSFSYLAFVLRGTFILDS